MSVENKQDKCKPSKYKQKENREIQSQCHKRLNSGEKVSRDQEGALHEIL